MASLLQVFFLVMFQLPQVLCASPQLPAITDQL